MKDYCKQIFGKSIRDLTGEILQEYFIEPKEETEILEFKSGHGDFEKIFTNNILRTVNAFLNSSGGVLIWGSPEDKAPEKGLEKECVGDLVPVLQKREKDQLINRITSSISYMPTGIYIERLPFKDGFIYIIEVHESESKPHQVNGQYHIRIDGQTKPAPHYIVDSMFKSVKLPELDGRIDFIRADVVPGRFVSINIAVIIFNRSIFINEKNVSFQMVVSPGQFKTNNRGEYFSSSHQVLHYGRPYRETHVIYISNEMLQNKDDFRLILTFGGELGPALTNKYTISTINMQTGPIDFHQHIVEIFENENYKEVQEKLGVTHEDNLKRMLNRRPQAVVGVKPTLPASK